MHGPQLPLIPNPLQQHLHILHIPLQESGKDGETDPMQASQHASQRKLPGFSKPGLHGPEAYRQLELLDRDIDEAGRSHRGFEFSGLEAQLDAARERAAGEQGAPLLDGGAWRKGVVIGQGDEVEFLGFNVAARFYHSAVRQPGATASLGREGVAQRREGEGT